MNEDRSPLDVSAADPSTKEKILEYAIETRKSEIDRLWSRSTLFWAFVAASFVAYATLYGKSESLVPRMIVAGFGVLCSFAWTLQNRGSKYWQEAWETKVERVEYYVLKTRLFANREPLKDKGFWGAAEFSVSRLVIALSDLTVIVWSLLIAYDAYLCGEKAVCTALAIAAFLAVYGRLMWHGGASGKS